MGTLDAISQVAAAVGAVGKNDRNTAQNFAFRGIDAVVNAVAPHMREHGLVVRPVEVACHRSAVEVGRNRTKMAHVDLTVTYRFQVDGGEPVDCVVAGEAMDAGDKAVSKAMSVAFRIALLQTFSLPTGDPDPDSTSYERSPAPVDVDALKQGLKEHVDSLGLAEDTAKAVGKIAWRDGGGDLETMRKIADEQAAQMAAF